MIVQLAEAASVAGLMGQVVAGTANSALARILVIASGALPVLVSATTRDVLSVLIVWLPKAKLVGLRPIPGAGATKPVPLRLTLLGVPAALWIRESVPVRGPVLVGVKVTLIVQLAPAANVAGLSGQVLLRANSALAAMLVIDRAAAPLLSSVTTWAALTTLRVWLPKAKLVVLRLTTGTDVAPVPLNVMVCGVPVALLLMVTAPVF